MTTPQLERDAKRTRTEAEMRTHIPRNVKALELRAGRSSFGIHRDGQRIASISTNIMDQIEIGAVMAKSLELLEWTRLLERALVYEIGKCRNIGDNEGVRMKIITLNMVRATISEATKVRL
jgi:hypothetical protein